MQTVGFLGVPEPTAEGERIFSDDVAEFGYVMNVSRLWAYQPATVAGLFDLLRQANAADSLSVRQRCVLVAACASAFGDSYCSLAWGSKLAKTSDAQHRGRGAAWRRRRAERRGAGDGRLGSSGCP